MGVSGASRASRVNNPSPVPLGPGKTGLGICWAGDGAARIALSVVAARSDKGRRNHMMCFQSHDCGQEAVCDGAQTAVEEKENAR